MESNRRIRRILFVGLPGSVHTARWIAQLPEDEWDVHLFPVELFHVREELPRVTLHDADDPAARPHPPRVRVRDRFFSTWGWDWPLPWGRYRAAALAARWSSVFPHVARRLARLIDRLRPDVVHSLTIHHAGRLTWQARKFCRRPFPAWIVSNWGSDIFLFGRLPEYAEGVRAAVADCDYYWCECLRDLRLAESLGLRGTALPIVPVCGGFDLDEAAEVRSEIPPSRRRVVVLKGYQDWAGRALVGLYALRLCADLLREGGYRVTIYTGGRDPEAVRVAAELFSQDTGVPVDLLPPRTPHREMLRRHGRARISIGLNISDSIAISMLEAMLMGSFPIQSNTGAGEDWIEPGRTGMLLAPEDPHPVADAIRRALTDDELVDAAAEINVRLIAERCGRSRIREIVLQTYRAIVEGASPRAESPLYPPDHPAWNRIPAGCGEVRP